MKTIIQKNKNIKTALAALLLATSIGCGSAEEPDSPGGGGAPVSPAPPVSQCVPINTQIPFSFTGGSYAYRKFVIGNVPGVAESMGQVLVGGPAQTGSLMGQGVDGFISLNAIPTDQTAQISNGALGYYPGANGSAAPVLINGNGVIQINPATQTDISNKVALGAIPIQGLTGTQAQTQPTGIPGPGGQILPLAQPTLIPLTSICVSGIAINMNLSFSNRLYLGDVYLYLNNAPHGYILRF